ncbi:uL15 family ribosomal protein [Candidatus Woesearchaeota archaeon]|nr:uL15 family ribosomal protein [Candidatus Woesearchaeota archaeon]
MTTNRRKKNSRQRGSHTHGWGSMKKHRGSGHKGGAGMAGTGKRADSKKPSVWKENYFGRKGFRTHNKPPVKAINIMEIESNIDKLGTQESGKYLIDLAKKGYNKLLGKGKATKKMTIKVTSASKKATEAVKQAGGDVLIE